jgi:hypothetical protein
LAGAREKHFHVRSLAPVWKAGDLLAAQRHPAHTRAEFGYLHNLKQAWRGAA